MLIGLVPVFNEEENVIGVLNKLEKHIDCIMVVNDGSFDNTDFLISDWLRDKKNIYYFSLQRNKGKGNALLQGFNFISDQHKKGKFLNEDVIVTVDGDGQHDPDEIKNMHVYFNKNNLDILIAKRDFSNYPKYRLFGNNLTSLIVSCLGAFKFEDIMCGFKMMKVALVIDLLNYYIGYKFSYAGEIGITAGLLGYKIDNKYPIQCSYYRKGTPGLRDFFVNLILYLLVASKIKFNKKIL